MWVLICRASSRHSSHTSSETSAMAFLRATSKPDPTRSRARRSCGSSIADAEALLELPRLYLRHIPLPKSDIPGSSSTPVQHLRDVPDPDLRVLATQGAADVHQAAHVARHQSLRS